MEKMDRLFGKEITNIMDVGYLAKHRNYSRVTSKVRGLSIEHIKKEGNKNALSISSRPETQIQQQPPLSQTLQAQCVPDYFEECLGFMLQQEKKNIILSNYMEEQPDINQNMRGMLIDWVLDLHLKFKMFPETMFTIVSLIDRYLSKKIVSRSKLQLVGVACLFIAAKYEETYQVPELRDLIHLSAKAFTREEFLEMEADIIKYLDFDLIVESSFKFFSPFSKLAKLQPKNHHLAQYVLEMSFFDLKFLKYNPSLLAASSIYLINKIRKRTPAWSDLMIAGTGYQEHQLKNCARQLCYLLENAEQLPNTKSLKRKFSLSAYHEVTKIRLERRQKQKN